MATTSNYGLTFRAVATVLLTFILPSFCVADADTSQAGGQSLKSLSLGQLGNIEVTTVTKEPEVVWKTPAAIYVITQDDIRRSGATSIPEALRLAPGVEVQRITADEWAIGIRGFGSRLSRSVLVLIDGRSVYSTLTAGVYWETQNILIEDIDRIEVICGPGGTIWGPNAVNGVINIITKSSRDTQGGLVSGGTGNEERGFGEARFGGTAGKNFSYRVSGMGFGWAPEFHSDGINYDSWQAGQAGFRMDWSKQPRDSYMMEGNLYKQNFGESVQVSTYNPPAEFFREGYADLTGGNLLWRWRRTLGDLRDFQLDAYFEQDNRHELNFGDLRNTADVDFIDRFPLPRQEISWGGEVYISHGHGIELYSGLYFEPPIRVDQLYSGYLQDQIALVPNKLSLFGGTKFLKTNYTGLLLEPSVRLLYNPKSTQTFWAAFTHAVRTPADVERDFYLSSYLGTGPDGLPFFARINGNPIFRSEDLDGYELGYRQLVKPRFYVDIATFFNQYTNLLSEDIIGSIYVEDDPAPPHLLIPANFGNGLKATTEGGEIAPEWKPTKFMRLRGSYSFLEMHVEKEPGSLDVGTAPIVQGSSPEHEILIQPGFDCHRRFPGPLHKQTSCFADSGVLDGRRIGGVGSHEERLVFTRRPESVSAISL